jgi:hypothetical protein
MKMLDEIWIPIPLHLLFCAVIYLSFWAEVHYNPVRRMR